MLSVKSRHLQAHGNLTWLKIGQGICKLLCRDGAAELPNEKLQAMIFGGYNARVEHPRTDYDWLTRDEKIVDDYVANPLCGFTASEGLLRDMLSGMEYIQKPKHLERMKKALPVLFIAGAEDPVGPYGKGVEKAAQEFKKAGMINVACKIYPGCRHEILNELNKQEVYEDVANWLRPYVIKD